MTNSLFIGVDISLQSNQICVLAEIGSIDYFKHNYNLAKYVGLYWNRSQSGKFEYSLSNELNLLTAN
ncbi:MAG: hypothetical protein RR703_02345 [Bacilli bacterium]